MSARQTILTLCTFVAALGVTSQGAVAQAPDEAFRSEIEELMQVTGALQIGTQFAGIMTASFLDNLRRTSPDVSPRVFEIAEDVIKEEIAKAFATGSLRTSLVSVYAKYFTRADVQGLLAFYRSDLGRKVIRTLPDVMQESTAAGQEWGKRLAPTVESALERRLRSEGLLR